ncbi:MAG: glutaminyl-peptide cyclotransferase [Sphingobacteriales bacterium]|nr:MAG: glutaminyl-peptide cyclotransferase [Sphingobacteriales bacterium]
MNRTRNFFASLALLLAACNPNEGGTDHGTNNGTGNSGDTPGIPVISYNVAANLPHDTSSFTEGLTFYNGQLWESTGEYGESHLYQTDLATGKALRSVTLDSAMFGEGVALLRDTIYQLTWREHKVLVYDAKSLKKIHELPLQPEGWGLTTDGSALIASDGSSNLSFYEPGTFKLLRTQSVTENGNLVNQLNELEWVNGSIYANVWGKDDLLKIDPASGQVTARLDLSQLTQRAKSLYPGADVANGVVYNPDTKKFYVTGKNWPELYELQFNF